MKISHRRAAQLGLLAATMVFAASVGVLFSQGGIGGISPTEQSAPAANDSQQIKTAPISLSTLAAPSQIHSETR